MTQSYMFKILNIPQKNFYNKQIQQLQDTKSTHKNQLHFYTLTMNDPKSN